MPRPADHSRWDSAAGLGRPASLESNVLHHLAELVLTFGPLYALTRWGNKIRVPSEPENVRDDPSSLPAGIVRLETSSYIRVTP